MQLRHLLASIVLGAPIASSCDDMIITEDAEVRAVRVPAMLEGHLLARYEHCKAGGDCLPLCRALHDGFVDRIEGCHLETDSLGDKVVYTAVFLYEDTCAGRRPAGFEARGAAGRPLGAFFAHQAMLEAASVQAFHDLRADLTALGAPSSLVAAAARAAADEVRHARTCARLARRHGGRWHEPPAIPAPRRSAAALAEDNVVEGCVRETYGAAVAAYQARAAGDRRIRRAMATIARDEAAHAALAWRVHRWLAPQLDAATQARVRDASRAARAKLFASAKRASVPGAGLPSVATAHHLLSALDACLWQTLV